MPIQNQAIPLRSYAEAEISAIANMVEMINAINFLNSLPAENNSLETNTDQVIQNNQQSLTNLDLPQGLRPWHERP